jgi:hypothetical protein
MMGAVGVRSPAIRGGNAADSRAAKPNTHKIWLRFLAMLMLASKFSSFIPR